MDLPDSWNMRKLNELCRKITDGTHVTPTYVNTGVPFVSVKDIRNSYLDFSETKFISKRQHEELTKRTKPEFGDILYTKVGTVGIAALVDTTRRFSIFVSVALLKPNPALVDPKFLVAQLNSSYVRSQAQRRVKGIGVPDLHLVEIKDFDIILPPLETQREIVSVLDRAKSLKQKRDQANQLTNKIIESVFVKMFGDPIRTDNWSMKKMSDVSEAVESGSTPLRTKEENFDAVTGIPLIKVENLAPAGYIQLKEKQLRVSKSANQRQKRSILREEDVLINIVGPPLGKVAYVTKEFGGCNINQAIAMIRPDHSVLNSLYLWCLLRFPTFNKMIIDVALSVRQANINLSEIRGLMVPVPPLALQRRFAASVRKIESLRSRQVISMQEINQLFQSLMHKAFSGKLPSKIHEA